MGIISLLLSKLGIWLAGAVGVLALLLWGRYQKNKAKRLEREVKGYQAKEELNQELQEIRNETKEELEKADKMGASDLADAFNELYDPTKSPLR